MKAQQDAGLQCRCGLIVPREQMVNFLCPECRLAMTLTEYDRPSPDRVCMTFPGPDYGLFSTKGQEEP